MIFRGEYRKIDAELLSTFTLFPSIKTKVAIRFPNFFFFFSAENRIGAERVNYNKQNGYFGYILAGNSRISAAILIC